MDIAVGFSRMFLWKETETKRRKFFCLAPWKGKSDCTEQQRIEKENFQRKLTGCTDCWSGVANRNYIFFDKKFRIN